MKICIVAHRAFGALTGENSGHIGGVERQTALLGEWLVKHGHEVSIITWHEDGPSVEEVRLGCRIIKLCREDEGVSGVRFFHPRWTALIRCLRLADADIYYHNSAEHVTGQIALWCQTNNRKFIFSVSSDADCVTGLPALPHLRERWLYKYGINHCDQIIAQTKTQQELLRAHFKLEATVIPMPGTPPQPITTSDDERFANHTVIWIGRLDKVKRLEWLLEIASLLPDVQFEVIGPTADEDPKCKTLLNTIDRMSNVIYRGKIRREDIHEYYAKATLLCCTSLFEGFPNTFTEAWSYGVPIVTTVDPDGIIQDKRLGKQAETIEGLVLSIRALLEDRRLWDEATRNSKNYYLVRHELNTVQLQFEKVFENTLSSG